jgi:hypothetical protein
VEDGSREKLEPYSGLSSEESYQSRELEKVRIFLLGHTIWFWTFNKLRGSDTNFQYAGFSASCEAPL